MSWDNYSQTPASNDISGYFQTGMAPSKVKNAGWDIMADLAQFMSLPTSGGTANAQTVTNTRQFGALFTGMRQSFIPGNTNTGAVTLAIDGLTAKNVFANGVAAIAGMLVAGTVAHVQYDGTQWQLLNPQRSTGSFTATATGLTTSPTCTVTFGLDASATMCRLTFGTGITGTSNATSFTLTGMPSYLTPAQTQAYYTTVEDATAVTTGSILFTGASAVITLCKSAAIGNGALAWTTTGTKAFANSAASSQNPAVIFSLI